MTNAWITHVKQFASKHHLKYGDALKHPQCKTTYHKSKGGMIPQRPDGPRSSARRGRRPQIPVEEQVQNPVIAPQNPVIVAVAQDPHMHIPTAVAEVYNRRDNQPLRSAQVANFIQRATSPTLYEGRAVQLINDSHELQAEIRILTRQLEANPRSHRLALTLRALQESETRHLAELRNLNASLSTDVTDVVRIPIANGHNTLNSLDAERNLQLRFGGYDDDSE